MAQACAGVAEIEQIRRPKETKIRMVVHSKAEWLVVLDPQTTSTVPKFFHFGFNFVR